MKNPKLSFLKYLLIFSFSTFLVVFFVQAWQAPTANPPNEDLDEFLTTSDKPQSKLGDLNIGGGLKYWITKLGDSFALKNDAGEIKFILGQDGNIGIGTSTPAEKLHVYGGKIVQDQSGNYGDVWGKWSTLGVPKNWEGLDEKTHYGLLVAWDSDYAFLGLKDYGSDRKDVVLGLEQDSDNFRFQVGGSDVMIIKGDGNVGIGTTTTQEKLEVNGNVKVSGGIVIGAPAGGNKGSGTINAEKIYLNGEEISKERFGNCEIVNKECCRLTFPSLSGKIVSCEVSCSAEMWLISGGGEGGWFDSALQEGAGIISSYPKIAGKGGSWYLKAIGYPKWGGSKRCVRVYALCCK